MSKFVKGHIVSQKHRDNLRRIMTGKYCGEKNPMWGKHRTDEEKKKISETRKSMFGGKYKKCVICGKKFWTKKSLANKKCCSTKCGAMFRKTGKYKECKICGKKIYMSKKRFNDRKYCSNKCKRIGQKTGEYKKCKFCNKEFYTNKTQNKIFCSRKCSGLAKRGDKHYGWMGGTNKFRDCIEAISKYKTWRLLVFKRDKFLCQMSDCDKTVNTLNAHHIIKLSTIIKNNNIKTVDDAENCKELWDIKNGITLCEKCHNKTKWKERLYPDLYSFIKK